VANDRGVDIGAAALQLPVLRSKISADAVAV